MSSPLLCDVDFDAVQQTISRHQNDIVSLDKEIEGFMRTIRRLQFQKEKHLADIRHCKGLITLAKRLPPEILASIFEDCVDGGWTRTPLVASHVCSSWRKAAMIPTVWAHIYVNLDARDPYQRTRLWLERSQEVQLTIDIEIGNDSSHLEKTMELLTSEIRRWKALTIKSALLHSVNQILQGCDKHTPYLRTVDISVAQEFHPPANNNDEHELVALRTSFGDAPQFKSLRIKRNLLPGRNMLPTSITNLSLQLSSYHSQTVQSISGIIDLLGDLSGLVSFSVEGGEQQIFNLDADPGLLVDMPRLESMIIMGNNNIMGILPHIKATSLTRLHLRSAVEGEQAPELGSWIGLFLLESSPPISLLEIHDLGLDPSVYARILPLLSPLQELRLHDCDVVDSTLREMISRKGFCPSLKRLDLRWCGRFSGRALVDLVHSRIPDGLEGTEIVTSSIEQVTLINCSFVKEEDILDLAKMTVCRLIHHDQDDFCYAYGCCNNERYRRRLKQRVSLNTTIERAYLNARLIL